MITNFDIDKIVNYLENYKADLPVLYKWNTKIEKLVSLEILTENQVIEFNTFSPYNRELQLKKFVGQKLKATQITNIILFEKICLWIVKDWGKILSSNDEDTLKLIDDLLKQEKPKFNRIASTSKVGAFLNPESMIIYDSRVAYSLNWIILSESAGQQYFPIPKGRNSKMLAFDVNVLIRLKNISIYTLNNTKQLDNRNFIKNLDKQLFINEKNAYSEMNELVKKVSKKLWKGDPEKEKNLYYTEMLLFSIADNKVFLDIIKNWNELTKKI